jgi:hypothetical protein
VNRTVAQPTWLWALSPPLKDDGQTEESPQRSADQNPNRTSASIPPSISMKMNDGFSPNTGRLQKSRAAFPVRRLPLSVHRNDPFHPPNQNASLASRCAPHPKIHNTSAAKHDQNPSRTSASIPPTISMKTNDRVSPNTGTLRNIIAPISGDRLPLSRTFPKRETQFLGSTPHSRRRFPRPARFPQDFLQPERSGVLDTMRASLYPRNDPSSLRSKRKCSREFFFALRAFFFHRSVSQSVHIFFRQKTAAGPLASACFPERDFI